MELGEYYERYRSSLAAELNGDFPRDIASCIAAGYYTGLSIEQLCIFITKRAEIASVSVALVNQNTSVADMEKIVRARESGKIYPAEILRHAFRPEEVKEDFRMGVFNEKST
ncbi:MAG: hypothetical protein KJ884_15800 [Gammaproteobacteria bacterium]|nr:hypothetical protein [Gammaproteobacteria bacterium]MBU1489167.1 hypothetical protein [Gammaproteobacteria bacterium]MBU2065280.1 hypothetical protein [Gammaproteobacteria bacterium]MBU2139406.1 hypothetical protein [Gammaproteobacteria bacterium]MBU2218594.1 hypothetical protein [Gammaproteobacteria bacterium]